MVYVKYIYQHHLQMWLIWLPHMKLLCNRDPSCFQFIVYLGTYTEVTKHVIFICKLSSTYIILSKINDGIHHQYKCLVSIYKTIINNCFRHKNCPLSILLHFHNSYSLSDDQILLFPKMSINLRLIISFSSEISFGW